MGLAKGAEIKKEVVPDKAVEISGNVEGSEISKTMPGFTYMGQAGSVSYLRESMLAVLCKHSPLHSLHADLSLSLRFLLQCPSSQKRDLLHVLYCLMFNNRLQERGKALICSIC